MKIAVFGAGYLGAEAAAFWTKHDHQVTVTTRHPEKLEKLSKIAEKSVVLKNKDEKEISHLLHANETLLVTISADKPDAYEEAYLQIAQMFRKIATQENLIRTLIYTSSTTVYGDHHGLWVDEASELHAKTEQGKLLIETERTYESLKELGWHVCILRLSEIYGPGRELSKKFCSFNGKTLLGNGENYTNMIHRDDAVLAIDYALRHRLEGIYNLSDDEHPIRKLFYEEVAKKTGCPSIQWDPTFEGWHGGNKRVSNHKIKAEGFMFHHPRRVVS
jgi:nucleoside-diphosphate-sugar epimerase